MTHLRLAVLSALGALCFAAGFVVAAHSYDRQLTDQWTACMRDVLDRNRRLAAMERAAHVEAERFGPPNTLYACRNGKNIYGKTITGADILRHCGEDGRR